MTGLNQSIQAGVVVLDEAISILRNHAVFRMNPELYEEFHSVKAMTAIYSDLSTTAQTRTKFRCVALMQKLRFALTELVPVSTPATLH